MPKKINVRAILQGKLQGMSNNDIASAYHCSKHSVADVVIIATEKEILPLGPIPNLSEEELYQLFFPIGTPRRQSSKLWIMNMSTRN